MNRSTIRSYSARILFSLLVLTNFNLISNAQISKGGTPISLQTSITKTAKSGKSTTSNFIIPSVKMPKMNNDSLLKRDTQQEGYTKGMNFAAAIYPDLNINNSGAWKTLDNGDEIWMLQIESEGATSLNFVLDYELKAGAKLFLYNKDSGQVLGAYTSENNKPWGRLAVQQIAGDKVIFEYFVPRGTDKGILGIKTVGHGYLQEYLLWYEREYSDFGRSVDCQIDINDPKGQGWQNEKRSVVKIVIQRDRATFSKSSGALINNTANDQTPYILTCEHALNGWSSEPDYTPTMGAENSIYFFNYESNVPGQDGDQSQSVSGAILRAIKPDLDFGLVELSMKVPANYKPYFAGWDRRNMEFEYAVGISHPMGDVKKIAKTAATVLPDQTFHLDEPYLYNTHYRVTEWTYGKLEGGSSGSPLFNNEHRIVGDLSGGTRTECGSEEKEMNDYQMLYYCWANTEVRSQQLKCWLDPISSGVEFMDGLDPFEQEKVYFYPDKELCYLDETVVFKDHSIGNYTNYRWEFGDKASPQTATGNVPIHVVYSEVGTYSASLTVTDQYGVDKTFTLDNYIEVFYRPVMVDFEANSKTANIGDKVTFTNLSTGSNTAYEWNFGEGAEPKIVKTTSSEPIAVTYKTTGKKDITLIAHNPLGNDTLTILKYMAIGEVIVADFEISEGPYFVNELFFLKAKEEKWGGVGYGLVWLLDGVRQSNWSDVETEYSFPTPGKHTIAARASSLYSVDTKTIEIEVFERIEAILRIAIKNDNLILCSVVNGKEGESYLWDFGDGNTSELETPEHEYDEWGTYNITLTITTDAEEIVRAENISMVPTGIEDVSNSEDFKIYPNPATEYIKILLPDKFFSGNEIACIQIYSGLGQMVYINKTNEKELTIDCNKLSRGYAVIVITNSKNKIVRKIMIN